MLAAAAAARPAPASEPHAMLKRKIPSSGEQIPVIGMGSSNTFDVEDSAAATDPLRAVLRALVEGGGTVIDTSPMYGRSETVLGDLVADLGLRPRLWLATKVWTRGREAGAAQIAESMRRLRTDRLELLQIHNLLDWREHLPTLRSLERAGKVRYSGITHYRADAHAELERVLTEERFDFLQVNYSLAERAADDAPAAVLPRQGHRRHGEPSVRGRRDVRARAGQAAATVGSGIRLQLVGAVLPEVCRVAHGGHVRDPGYLEARQHARQLRRRRGAATRRKAARENARVLGCVIGAATAPCRPAAPSYRGRIARGWSSGCLR